ncbi:T3SS effector HopA1 family protein [Bradyrhizobium sp. SZCCHNS3002]|uniref:T3SS effector HopA1 family protein n=1 Tax=Bradyrhizobium sp. SZCCHNS3002 TaxID=3057310 RepID=UPI0028E4F3D3|nr:T3SS effector HopA1 family protein [Bradyrhizobium sp. SZCCHNS3002]
MIAGVNDEIRTLARRFLETDTGFQLDSVAYAWSDDSAASRVETLADALYQQLYTRKLSEIPTVAPNIEPLPRGYSATLDNANTGRGWQLRGFMIVSQRDSELLVAAPCGTRYQAKLNDIVAQERGPDPTVAIQMPKGDVTSSNGFYIASGDAFTGDLGRGVIRFYWNIGTARLGPLLMEGITSVLNGARLPFRFKIVNSRFGLARRDTAVLYISEQSARLQEIDDILELTRGYERMLIDDAPLFTERVQLGVSRAKDPRDGRSFGQYVCATIAETILSRSRQFESIDGNELCQSVFAALGSPATLAPLR